MIPETAADILSHLRETYRSIDGRPLTDPEAARVLDALAARGIPAALACCADTRYACRLIEAVLTQPQGLLHDPIEDHPAYAGRVRAALRKAEAEDRRKGGPHLGSCFGIWEAAARTLKADGIVWFSESELNPTVCFDS